ncbi:MAG: excinuclease ABC subunit UvrA, partial [Ignavibacteriales bacterium]|nr:excinuclease ABC subunit UvrA [Ignavibacteriales bacterium]
IEQKATSGNPRSTVGTVTEIYDYLRLLFARTGLTLCYKCGKPVSKQTTGQIIDKVTSDMMDKRIVILAPVIRGRKGHYRELFEEILSDGFIRVRVDKEMHEITKGFQVDRYKIHNIEIVVDRMKVTTESVKRLTESLEVALNYGNGSVIVTDGAEDYVFSRHLACLDCGISYQELAPNSFSFNTPFGACPACDGLGENKELDIDLIIPDWDKSINEEGIAALGKPRTTYIFSQLRSVASLHGFTFDTPLKELNKAQKEILLNGSKEKIPFTYNYSGGKSVTYQHKFTGIIGHLKNYFDNTASNHIRDWVEAYMNTVACKTCGGGRLKKESLSVLFQGKNIAEISHLSIRRARDFFENITPTGRDAIISAPILKEIKERLDFLLNVGLDYLALDRSSRSLSGGEAQRIRLATQIGTQLAGVLYVLDEPSIGLHQSDNIKLIDSLRKLRDLSNTVIVVEHDRETIESADYLIDLGPGAGEHGGEVCAMGKTKDLLKLKKHNSVTLDYLNGTREISIPEVRRTGNGKTLTIKGATGNNLRNVTAKFPLATFIAITGVSGSGKSTLINETVVKLLMKHVYHSKQVPMPFKKAEGLEFIDKVIEIDQSPIGRTPRSNPATYTGLFTHIRDMYAQLPEAKMRGYATGRFSFNVTGGRCEACGGDGLKKIEMNFLPDVYVTCDVCHGKRYNRETLEVLFKTKSISDVLEMTVDEAVKFFEDQPRINRKIKGLHDVGLGYIRLGQQATTLSGGEAQRVKLATELSKVSTGNTIYFLDEPTTGLHFEDVNVLLKVLNKLVDKGNTVVVVEHNLDVVKTADWVIDLGPGGGEFGGDIIVEGTPETVIKHPLSLTGRHLKREMQ